MSPFPKDLNSIKAEYNRKRPTNIAIKIGPGLSNQVYDFFTQSHLSVMSPILQISSQLSDGKYYVCTNCISLLKSGTVPFLSSPILGVFCPACTPICSLHQEYMGLDKDGTPRCTKCLPCILDCPSYIKPYQV